MFTGGFDVMLYVRDFRRSVAFYREGLGFELRGYWDDSVSGYVPEWRDGADLHYAVLAAGPLKWTLHGTDEERRGGAAIYHLGVEDADAYHAALAGRGIEARPPRDMPWGWRMFFVSDPDGHLLGFYSPL